MPTFVAHHQLHRGMVRRSNPTRREPGLLDSIVDPIVSDVVNPVVNKVASSVVDPVVNNVVKPIATPLLKVASSVVAPIVAPLTQGGNSKPTQATQPPPPANTPPPATSPSGGSPGGGNGGGAGGGNGGGGGSSGNGNGTGHSGGGNNGNGHSGENGNGNSGGGGHGSSEGSGSGSNGGNGSSGGNGGGSGTGGGGESGNANGNGGGTGGDDRSGTGTGSEAGPVNNSSSGGVPGGGTDDSEGVSSIGSGQTPTGTSDPAASSGSDFLTTGGNVPVNAGGDPNAAAPDSSTSGHGDDSATGSTAFNPGPSGSGTSATGIGNGNGGSGVGSGSTDGAGVTSGQKGGLSGGAIAGIVVGVLLVVAIVLILMIRRQRKRSKARRHKSWFARNGASSVYNDGTQFNTVIGHNGVRTSVRSSFETTVDHSQTPRQELDFEQVPNLPPMAQLRGDPVLLVNLDTPATGLQDAFTSHDSPSMSRRFSIGTATSSVGDGDGSQWLTVNPRMGLGGGQNSPMSVRLSSPVEAFAFPRPPTDVSGSDYSSLTIASPSAKSGIQDMPVLPVPSLSVNPFDDPSPSVASASAGKTRKILKPINVAAANPFADPLPNLPVEPNTPSAVHPEFQEVEMIRRPFVPTLSDEVMVEVGDKVKILQMFDDGWSLVEKNPVLSMDSKETDKSPQVGLIPIDCLRSVGLDVNEFIASKRVSSYSETSSRRGTLAPAADSAGLAF